MPPSLGHFFARALTSLCIYRAEITCPSKQIGFERCLHLTMADPINVRVILKITTPIKTPQASAPLCTYSPPSLPSFPASFLSHRRPRETFAPLSTLVLLFLSFVSLLSISCFPKPHSPAVAPITPSLLPSFPPSSFFHPFWQPKQ